MGKAKGVSRKVRHSIIQIHGGSSSRAGTRAQSKLLGLKDIAQEQLKAKQKLHMQWNELDEESRNFLSQLHEDRNDDFIPTNDASASSGGPVDNDEWEDIIEKDGLGDTPIACAVRDVLDANRIGRRYMSSRTWRERKEAANRDWDLLLDVLTNAYLDYRYGVPPASSSSSSSSCPSAPSPQPRTMQNPTREAEPAPTESIRPDAAEPEDVDMQYEYTFTTINLFTLETTKTIPRPASSTHAAIDLARHGYLAKTPSQPEVAVSFTTLELFHRLRLRKPSLSIEAFTKVICDYYSIPFRRHFREILGDTYEIYVRIQRLIRRRIDAQLGWDTPNWRVQNACRACCYVLEGEPAMKLSRLWSHDGNNSLKRMVLPGNRTAGDTRTLEDSDYFLSQAYVDRFAGEVRARKSHDEDGDVSSDRDDPDLLTDEGDPTDGGPLSNTAHHDIEHCTKNWKAAAADEKKKMWAIFDETGIFASACRHGLILWLVDMKRSGELAKYPLATFARNLEVLPPGCGSGYDINCAFAETVKHSSLGAEASAKGHTFCVGAFHGYTHNYQCQLKNHPNVIEGVGLEDFETLERVFSCSNQLASITRYASPYRRRLYIETHFRQWDEEKYANLGTFILNNYTQALKIIAADCEALVKAKEQYQLTDTVLDQWSQQQVQYFASLGQEPEYDVLRVIYVELLQSLRDAHNDFQHAKASIYSQATPPVTFVVENPSSTSRSYNSSAAATRRLETKRRVAQERLDRIQEEVIELETKLGLARRWLPSDDEYIETCKYIAERRYHQALHKVHQLVTQRLFELHKLNIAGTGYKLRTQLSKSLQTRCKAIRRAINAYNTAAKALDPPRPTLDWTRVSNYTFIEDLAFLNDTRFNLRDQDWAKPVHREILKLRNRIARANEEITRCNVEARRLHTAILDEEDLFASTLSRLQKQDPGLYGAVRDFITFRRRINKSLLSRIQQIHSLPGFSGDKTRGIRIGKLPPALDTHATTSANAEPSPPPIPATNTSPFPTPSRAASHSATSMPDSILMPVIGPTSELDGLNFPGITEEDGEDGIDEEAQEELGDVITLFGSLAV